MSSLSDLTSFPERQLARPHPRVRNPHPAADLALLLSSLFLAIPLCLSLLYHLILHPWIVEENPLQLYSELIILQQIECQFVFRFAFRQLGALSQSSSLRHLGWQGLGEVLETSHTCCRLEVTDALIHVLPHKCVFSHELFDRLFLLVLPLGFFDVILEVFGVNRLCLGMDCQL